MSEAHPLFALLCKSADADCATALERLVREAPDRRLNRINATLKTVRSNEYYCAFCVIEGRATCFVMATSPSGGGRSGPRLRAEA